MKLLSKKKKNYDNYRSRLLHGKRKLMGMVPYFAGMRVLLFAGGTGDIARYIPPIPHTITCMDLCRPLLEVAAKRYPHMQTVHADAEQYTAAPPVDVVICSYSLTMIPDWRAAIERMVQSCRVGGYVCCTDFVVDGTNAVRDVIVKSVFAGDHVHLNADHIRYLTNHPRLHPRLHRRWRFPADASVISIVVLLRRVEAGLNVELVAPLWRAKTSHFQA